MGIKHHKKDILTLEYFHTTLPKKHKKIMTQSVVDEINLLVEEPDYGEEFKSSIITHTTILEGKESWSLRQYIDAVKFYSLTAAGLSQAKSYVKVFPERLQARIDRDQGMEEIKSEASRFNGTELVNRIRQQALVPLHLVNQGTTQLAINTLTTLMLKGRSEVARVSAATALLKELRPPEIQKVELALGLTDEAMEARAKQETQLLDIAENQRRLLAAGHDINDVQQIQIKATEYTDVEVDEDE